MLIRVNGINIDYQENGSGLALIFIHAFPLNQTMWDDQLLALQSYYRTITLDLRGFGKSDAPQDTYSMDQMAADVRGLMSALQLDRAVLVGVSMGGYIALAFCRNYPEALHSLVLADTRARADTPEARELRLKSAEKAEREGSHAIAEDMIPKLLGKTSLEHRPSVVQRVRSMIEANSSTGIAGAQRGMAERRDSTDILSEITCPALVIVGSEDILTPIEEAESLVRGIRDARLRVIKGTGHLPSIECPEQFNSSLIEFIGAIKDEH